MAIRRRCLNAIIVAATILHTAIGQMFVDGVSMAKVDQVVETLDFLEAERIHGLTCVP
jgi:hypothetical protein